jgi:hypothetical protein
MITWLCQCQSQAGNQDRPRASGEDGGTHPRGAPCVTLGRRTVVSGVGVTRPCQVGNLRWANIRHDHRVGSWVGDERVSSFGVFVVSPSRPSIP